MVPAYDTFNTENSAKFSHFLNIQIKTNIKKVLFYLVVPTYRIDNTENRAQFYFVSRVTF